LYIQQLVYVMLKKWNCLKLLKYIYIVVKSVKHFVVGKISNYGICRVVPPHDEL